MAQQVCVKGVWCVQGCLCMEVGSRVAGSEVGSCGMGRAVSSDWAGACAWSLLEYYCS